VLNDRGSLAPAASLKASLATSPAANAAVLLKASTPANSIFLISDSFSIFTPYQIMQ
jgi:hypothetical protein